MFFEVLVYCLVCVVLFIYSFNVYRRTQKGYILMFLSLQIIATVAQIAKVVSKTTDVDFSIYLFAYYEFACTFKRYFAYV